MPTWMIQAGMWSLIAVVTLYQFPGSEYVHKFITFAVAWTIAGYLKDGK